LGTAWAQQLGRNSISGLGKIGRGNNVTRENDENKLRHHLSAVNIFPSPRFASLPWLLFRSYMLKQRCSPAARRWFLSDAFQPHAAWRLGFRRGILFGMLEEQNHLQ
jgi:hypothetical protein